jgi:hypothetical protein
MKIELNTQAREQRVLNQYNDAMEKIASHAENGIDLTELIFPNDMFDEVRAKITSHMRAFDVKFVWESIGNMGSISVSGGRLMRFKLLS